MGTLGAQSHSSKVDSENPVPSFGRRNGTISGEESEQEESKNLGKALSFSEEKFNVERRGTKNSNKTNENIVNNDSMMNINPFYPSEIHSH